jgi:hypothetical protein
MSWNKAKHIALVTVGLLSTFAGVIYQSQLANNHVGAGLTFGVLAGLVPIMWSRLQVILGKPDQTDITKIQKVFHIATGLAGIVMPIVVLVHGKFDPSSQAFIVSGYVTTFLGDLVKAGASLIPTSDSKSSNGPTMLAVLCLAGGMLQAATARAAEPTPSDVAPPISFCLGKSFHCVLPDFNLHTAVYDLEAKKWKTGVSTVAVGYMLLFYSDQPWGSGVAVHAAGQWDQGQPSYFAIEPTMVFAKYFELGFSFVFLDGAIEKNLVIGLSANAELFMRLLTGKSLPTRLSEAKLAYHEKMDRMTVKLDEDRFEGWAVRGEPSGLQ